MDDKLVCYEHYSEMEPRCYECPDKRECALATYLRINEVDNDTVNNNTSI